MNDEEIKNKVLKAKRTLMVDNPLIGLNILNTKVIHDISCIDPNTHKPTIAIDNCNNIIYHPEFIRDTDFGNLKMIITYMILQEKSNEQK